MISRQQIIELELTGKLTKLKHPFIEYYIYCYTKNNSHSLDELEKKCKGIILDKDYNIVSYPLGQMELLAKIPTNLDVDIYEKIDGTFMQLYWIEGTPFLCSKS